MVKKFGGVVLALLGLMPVAVQAKYATGVFVESYSSGALERNTNLIYTLKDDPVGNTVNTLGGDSSNSITSSVLYDRTASGLGNFYAAHSAQGVVEAGVIRVMSQASAGTFHAGAGYSYYDLKTYASGYASGNVEDSMTWSVDGVAVGTPIKLRFRLDSSGDVDFSSLRSSTNDSRAFGYAQISWFAQISGRDPSAKEFYGSFSSPTTQVTQNFDWSAVENISGLGAFTFEQIVYSGLPVTLRLSAGANVSITTHDMCAQSVSYCTTIAGGASAVAKSDFMHTFSWGGVQGVSLADGSALNLADLRVSADSGLDYRVAQAVPEPSAYALLLAGLCVVGIRRRAFKPGNEKIPA